MTHAVTKREAPGITTVFRVSGQNARERASRAVRKVLDVPSFYTTRVCRPPSGSKLHTRRQRPI